MSIAPPTTVPTSIRATDIRWLCRLTRSLIDGGSRYDADCCTNRYISTMGRCDSDPKLQVEHGRGGGI